MGMPITLCVLYLLAGKHFNLPLYGVNLPNLFILTYKTRETQFYINVFNSGIIFEKEDIDKYIAQLEMSPADVFYQPCTALNIVSRVLLNLVMAYERLGENKKMADMKSLLAVLDPPREQQAISNQQ